jgi:hypothetical protein
MKRLFVLILFSVLAMQNQVLAKVISNEKIDAAKVETASKIISGLQRDMKSFTAKGSGPFVAAVYDDKGNLVVKVANSVVNEHC